MEKIIDLVEAWKATVLHDSLNQNGRSFLRASVCKLLHNERIDRIHVMCYEPMTRKCLSLKPENLNKLVYHEFYKDPLGWEGSKRNVYTDLEVYLRDNSSETDKRVVIVFDCLDMLLLNRPVSYTCRTIHNLSHRKFHTGIEECRVLALMHDIHEDETVSAINHIEHFNVSEACEFTDIATEESIAAIQNTVEVNNPSTADPTANLTFNLKLTDNEKTARSQVKLPYMHDTKKQEVTLHRSVGDGKIFYQPDEADDFDEDDPDDDLDI